ncbi:GtrA family protein [Rhodanobacter thiooxydans]|uniref:GtrA family protein n=1 Tax=Rhodanobacter thiooxydans TaxID=416169 RepID=UPI000D34B0EE|nr:GtrA family protein [Rhodanobacter thiooxydans]
MSGKFVRFLIVGGGCALLYFVLMWFCRANLGFAPFVATICAYGVSFCVAYVLQHRWTFRSEATHKVTLPRYTLAQVTCALLTAGITQAISHIYPQSPNWILAGVSTVLASGLSFVLSSLWVFAVPQR